MASDPFGTAELRRRVLDAWRASPSRFRADANVEDDLALTGYRDRVVVELAQNAADAATRAGAPGRLVLILDGETLTASNVGAPLDAAGVESISVARASAKADEVGTVGRFGVGFAAVLAVTDEPVIASTTGSVRWSRADALSAASALPELRDELAARGDRVPVLRLPFAADTPAAIDADTVVTLPLLDAAAVEAVRAQLIELEPTVLLALPALAEIVVQLDGVERTLRSERTGDIVVLHDGAVASRWLVASSSGPVPPELLAERPAEEQRLDQWQVSWALPVDADRRVIGLPESVAGVVRAPTAVDDPLTVPAILIASYPLDASRRRVTPGPLADAVTGHAADLLARLVAELPPHPSVLRLLPTGFPDGPVDGALHAAVRERLEEIAWLPLAGEPDVRQRVRDAVLVADPLVDVLRDVVPSLLPAGWAQPELIAFGVTRPSLADLVAALAAAADQSPGWWHQLYAALDEAVAAGPDRDALGALPVPLVDGSTAIGPRGVALPTDGTGAGDLSAVGIRLAHPQAAHPLLAALGAVEGKPRDLLAQPQVRAAVEASYDADDPEPIAAAVLSLLLDGGGVEELPWLADLALVDDIGEWRPAGELLLPGGLMASVVAADSDFQSVAAEWVERWGADALVAAGVLDAPVLVRDADAVGPTHDLDDETSWWGTLPSDSAVEQFVAVRDLEQVRPDALADLLSVLAQPPLRAAIVDPAVVTRADGSRIRVRSYTAWWLSNQPVLAGRRPRDLRDAGSEPLLRGLYDVAPAIHDDELLRAVGVLGSLDEADPDDVLARLADERREVDREQLRGLNRWLSSKQVTPPARVRAVRDSRIEVVDADDAVVVDAPDLLPLLGNLAVVPVALADSSALAAQLDLPLASELAAFDVRSAGTVDDDAVVHDVLRIADVDGVESEVAWRLIGGTLHVDARRLAVGLGRGRAWRDGRWAGRHRRTEALIDPAGGMLRDDEDDLDNVPEE